MVLKNKKSWHDHLPKACLAYRTKVHTSTTCAPYNLVFGSEVLLPFEAQLLLLKIATQLTTPGKNVKVRLVELEAIYEKKFAT